MITDRNIRSGQRFAAVYKGHRAELLYEAEGAGTGRFVLLSPEPRREFKSLSMAGRAVTGGSINGWVFWTPEGEGLMSGKGSVTPVKKAPRRKKEEEAETVDRQIPTAQPKVRHVRVIKKLPNQNGVPEGMTKFWCSACMRSFLNDGATLPDRCPTGHAARIVDDLDPGLAGVVGVGTA